VPALLIRHQVRDFDAWRRVFDDEAETRRANGSRRELQFRSATNASEIWVLLEWDDLYRARLFVTSDDLRAALDRGGVIDLPDYWYLEDADPVLP
jgi:hypothetical protein